MIRHDIFFGEVAATTAAYTCCCELGNLDCTTVVVLAKDTYRKEVISSEQDNNALC